MYAPYVRGAVRQVLSLKLLASPRVAKPAAHAVARWPMGLGALRSAYTRGRRSEHVAAGAHMRTRADQQFA